MFSRFKVFALALPLAGALFSAPPLLAQAPSSASTATGPTLINPLFFLTGGFVDATGLLSVQDVPAQFGLDADGNLVFEMDGYDWDPITQQ